MIIFFILRFRVALMIYRAAHSETVFMRNEARSTEFQIFRIASLYLEI